MKPDPQRMLEQIAATLAADVMPNVQPRYRQMNVALLAGLALAAREEFERAAARRVEENAALRALFAGAAPVVADASLAQRLREAAAASDADLRISALDASNRALRALLIELHAHVEGLATPAAHALDSAIWAELVRSAERRRLSAAPF
ncbi:MAG TPA: hypothetical protein VFT98_02035 [Myxococcota bacterium]|nr:hypothetical protein [Myxococcota bacterium]